MIGVCIQLYPYSLVQKGAVPDHWLVSKHSRVNVAVLVLSSKPVTQL